MKYTLQILLILFIARMPGFAAENHSHAVPEKLGQVDFATSCSPDVAPAFNRAVALLHSFAYGAAEQAFSEVARADENCAMAHWGVAMSYYHPLWAPPNGEELRRGGQAIETARQVHAGSPRERTFIEAVATFYRDFDEAPHADRARAWSQSMAALAESHPDDAEAQIFFALSLLSTASPNDRTHTNQKRAVQILEPLLHRLPEHPGVTHYLIHAYDNAELAAQGLDAARAYAQIAPSAPHALHMPSHIFTRRGLWDDSVESNLSARKAAREEDDTGEELHAMDYLTYAYLQLGRFEDAERVVREAAAMTQLAAADFKIGYAANAMPVRLAIEQGRWADAATLQLLPDSNAQSAAMVYWARAVGQARDGRPQGAAADLAKITECNERLKKAGNTYWATQTGILEQEARAWIAFEAGDRDKGIALMRDAANEEDAVEKLPVTPGPIVPAREQLGEMLLASGRDAEAEREFKATLELSPGRRGALLGVARAARL